jgi:multicomponent Na+:H+ antiporter subunit F
MTAAETILSVTGWVALVLLAAAFLLTVWRVVQGPTLPDRVVALDMLVGIVIGFIALIAIRTGFTLYIDIAIALGLVGFLATVAFARFILAGAKPAASKEASADTAELQPVGKKPSRKAAVDRQSKSIDKPASKTSSKSASKTTGKQTTKTSAKPRKPAKGE